MLTVRLMGTRKEVETLAACLGALVEVLEASPDYPNRGASTLVRRYLTVRVTDRTLERVGLLLQRRKGRGGAETDA
jgi:hypothetical protein